MPTARRRYPVTETDDIAAALAVAAQHWPADAGRPSRLLRHLILAGKEALGGVDNVAHRRLALNQLSELSGTFGPNALDELREDWPE